MRGARTSPERVEVYVVLGAIALLGILAAPLPFTGDQALFASGARQLARGGVLYRDFWDVKQPGIYLFYVTGGTLFGYSEVALHLFEVGYQLLFAVVLVVTLRRTFRHRWIGPLVALFVLGTYYATIEPVELGQVESLVGFPLYLTVWCSLRALGGIDPDAGPDRVERTSARSWWLVAAGLFGGVVLVLKLVLAPIVAGVLVLTLWELARAVPNVRNGRLRAVASGLGAMAAGLLVPIAMTVAYLAAYGQLETARWTYFTVSAQTTGIAGRPISRLVDGGFKTGARWALPLGLGLIGVVAAARRGWDRLERRLAAWIVLGVPVFLVQHWWIYTYAMFLVPVGIFAGYGLEAVVDAWARARKPVHAALLAAAVVLLLPAAVRVASNGRDVASHDFALSADARAQLRVGLEPNYGPAARWASFLHRRGTPRGGVYVLGNPLDLYLADRTQTVAINGWSPEQYPQSVWARLRAELLRSRPEQLVVDRFSDTIMRERSPETRRLIAERYVPVGRSGPDRWYELRATVPQAR